MPSLDKATKDKYLACLGSYTQFEDLTEIPYVYKDIKPIHIQAVKTEFMFWLAAPHNSSKLGIAKHLGLKPVSTMNNWWPTHAGETRALTLYWGKPPEPDIKEVPKPIRCTWQSSFDQRKEYANIIRHLAASGCGLKIGEPPLDEKLFNRFFTLMRMPLEMKPEDKLWLETHNYRHLDTGALAQYWVNGWKPDKYTVKKEFEYFGVTLDQWRLEGNRWL